MRLFYHPGNRNFPFGYILLPDVPSDDEYGGQAAICMEPNSGFACTQERLNKIGTRLVASAALPSIEWLTDTWKAWCAAQHLECMSADEMPMDKMHPTQRAYVRTFMLLWEAVAGLED